MIRISSHRIALLSACFLASSGAFAQDNTDQAQPVDNKIEAVNKTWRSSMEPDGVYDRAKHVSVIMPWQPIREADVMWKKRVWREIDTRELQNIAFRFPGDETSGGGYFIEILLHAITTGKIKAYSGFDDKFTSEMSKDAVMELTKGKSDSTQVPDPVTGEIKIVITHTEFNPDLVTKFRIKEDIIFDRNLGRKVVRIIGIAPIKDDIDPSTGQYRGQSPMFWLYYPDLREVLAQYEVYNPENDVARITWDDFFENRNFASRIVKISNPYDDYIQSIPGITPMESLYKSQEYNEMLFNKEHDMWVY